jgi:nitric oxide reductase subunit B
MSSGSRHPMDVSPLWLQAMLLTFVVGFAILGYLALRVHSEHAPVPGRVVDETGRLLMTREAILQGQEAFLTHGLMQFGSVYGLREVMSGTREGGEAMPAGGLS